MTVPRCFSPSAEAPGAKGRSVVDTAVAVVFPISAFVAAGFEHSIANLYLMPLAMLWVPKLIIDGVVQWVSHRDGSTTHIWNLVALEFGLACLSDVLSRAGAATAAADSSLLVRGGLSVDAFARLPTYRDHRIAMAAGILSAGRGGLLIDDPGCVAKSYPRFFQDLDSLCVRRG